MFFRTTLLSALFLVACGGQIGSGIGDSSPNDSATSDAGTQGCPSTVPAVAQLCEPIGLVCVYGHDPRWTCNSVATCENQGATGSWSDTSPASDCPTPMCDSTVVEGQACQGGAACNDSTQGATKFCNCVSGGPARPDGGNGGSWMCSHPDTNCPAMIPTLGTACSQPDLTCNYGVCGGPSGLAVACGPDGKWAASNDGVPCPL